MRQASNAHKCGTQREIPSLCKCGRANGLAELPTPCARIDTTWYIKMLVSIALYREHCRVFVIPLHVFEAQSIKKIYICWQVPAYSKHLIILAVPVVECH